MKIHLSLILALVVVTNLAACSSTQAPATPTLAPTYTALPSPTATATPIPTTTSTPTPTPTLTPLPTSTPTKTPRPTPIPAANADAMIDWKKLNLPEGFRASDPKEIGIDKGEHAFNFFIGDEEIIYNIEKGFFFSNKEEDNLTFGYTVVLTTTEDLEYYDLLIDNQMELRRNGSESKEPGFKAAELPQKGMIGEKSAGVTASYKNTLRNGDLWHLDSIAFRTGNVGATVFLRYTDETPSPITIDKLAQVYADSIQKDYHGCRLVSLKYLGSSPQMEFEYQAEGFFPNEPRFLVIEGDYQIGGKTEKFGAMAAGMAEDAPQTDSQGNIQETWEAGVISGQDVDISGDYQFSLGGWYSGCVITQTVTIPSP